MIVPGSAHALLLSTSGYTIPYSLRFRASNTAYIRRTIGASSTSTTIATWSFWIKRGAFGAGRQLIVYNGNVAGSGNTIQLEFTSGSAILAYFNGAGSTGFTTNALFRDPSAWYHVVLAYDSTQATDSNRSKLYVNGTQITSFASVTYPALNQAFNAGSGDYQQMMGLGATLNADGYMAEVNFIDGQALTPSSFGQTDSATGVWVPKRYGGTYGTNGFYLKFADASAATAAAIGKDSSGNGNNFTPSGISVTSGVTFDQMTDTPTLNYAVFDALSPVGSASSIGTLSAANMTFDHSAANYAQRFGSFAVNSGKWYFEYTITTFSSGKSCAFGIGKTESYPSGAGAAGSWTGCVAYGDFGDTYLRPITEAAGVSNTSGVASMTFAVNDVIMIAFDVGAGKFWMGKNGTWFDSGNPAGGTNEKQTFTANINWRPWCVQYGLSAAQSVVNYGQRAFSYTPPTGFKALNTANLPTPSIKKGSLYMDATLRTGTGATASVSSLGFQPNFVWIKSRSAATNHNLFDSTRGVQKGLGSNLQSGQYTDANSLTAFNSNGYSLGSDASSRGVNINTNTYVDWAWKEGATPGFDVVTFAGTGAAQAVNHGLGVAPEFMILRVYDDTLARTWPCWHKNLTSAAYYLPLEGTAAEAVDTTMFNSTAPTSTQFTAGSYNSVSTKNSVAYLWASVAGFSMIGSWTGNASTDGPFVWCGFRPRFLFLRNKSAASYWIMLDSVRNTANAVTDELLANTANAENGLAITSDIDFLASGFKIRTSDANLNQSGDTIIFAAFAENPFKYARAR